MKQGTESDFWSIGANSATIARHLAILGSDVDPEYSYYKSDGFTVRCVSVNGKIV